MQEGIRRGKHQTTSWLSAAVGTDADAGMSTIMSKESNANTIRSKWSLTSLRERQQRMLDVAVLHPQRSTSPTTSETVPPAATATNARLVTVSAVDLVVNQSLSLIDSVNFGVSIVKNYGTVIGPVERKTLCVYSKFLDSFLTAL